MQVKRNTPAADLISAAKLAQKTVAELVIGDADPSRFSDLETAAGLFARAVDLLPSMVATGQHSCCFTCDHQVLEVHSRDWFGDIQTTERHRCACADLTQCPIVNGIGIFSDDDPTVTLANCLTRQAG